MVRSGHYRWFIQATVEHLYDLSSDPYEQNTLLASGEDSGEYGEMADKMKASLLDFLMHTQVNHADGYQNLFTRIGLTGLVLGDGQADARMRRPLRSQLCYNGMQIPKSLCLLL